MKPDDPRLECQLHDLPQAGSTLSTAERFVLRMRQIARFPVKALRKVMSDPMILASKLRKVTARLVPNVTADSQQPIDSRTGRLGLMPGDWVRVKSLEDILATLDEDYRFDRMGFMPGEMGPFCGGVHTVRKRVIRFFDERNQRLLRLRDVVILDDVYCEPRADSRSKYAGCARTCYLFWKEAWLEREPPDENQ